MCISSLDRFYIFLEMPQKESHILKISIWNGSTKDETEKAGRKTRRFSIWTWVLFALKSFALQLCAKGYFVRGYFFIPFLIKPFLTWELLGIVSHICCNFLKPTTQQHENWTKVVRLLNVSPPLRRGCSRKERLPGRYEEEEWLYRSVNL